MYAACLARLGSSRSGRFCQVRPRFVVVKVPGSSNSHSAGAKAAQARARRLPRYWTVRPGDTLSQISSKTGLTVAQLEALNPQADPGAIVPGERLTLRRQPPSKSHPK